VRTLARDRGEAQRVTGSCAKKCPQGVKEGNPEGKKSTSRWGKREVVVVSKMQCKEYWLLQQEGEGMNFLYVQI
jgi:hypothetical protein